MDSFPMVTRCADRQYAALTASERERTRWSLIGLTIAPLEINVRTECHILWGSPRLNGGESDRYIPFNQAWISLKEDTVTWADHSTGVK